MKPYLALILMVASAVCAQQPAAPAHPWETWQPPEVVLPDPNGFEVFQDAFVLKTAVDRTHVGDQPEHPPGWPEDRWHEGPPDLPLRERLHLYDEVLVKVREALKLPTRLPPVRGFGEPLSYLAGFRSIGRLLAMEAEVRRQDGDYAGAAASALDAIACGLAAATQGSMVGMLVGIVCENLGVDSLVETTPHLQASEAKAALARLREQEAKRPPLAEILSGEEVFMRSAIRRLVNDPDMLKATQEWLVPGKPGPEQARRLLDETLPRTWNGLAEHYGQWRAVADLPYAARARLPGAPDDPLLKELVPALRNCWFRNLRQRCLTGLLELQLAARAFTAERGQLPGSLEDLVPTYLPAIPADPFGGYRVKLAEKTLTIYSLGPDEKDDGGRAWTGERFDENTKGDVVVKVTLE